MTTTQEFRAAVEAVLGCLPITPESNYPDWELQADVCPIRVSLGHGSVSPLTVFLQVESGNKDFLRTLGANPDTGKWNIVAAMFHNDPAAVLRELQRRLACVGYVPPLDAPMDLTLPADALLAAVRGTGLVDGDELRVVIADGKYTVLWDPVMGLRALRYGEEWRNMTGDNLVYSLAFELDELRKKAQPPAGLPLTPEEKRLLTEFLTNAVEIPVTYPAGGHMAAIVGKTQDTFRGLLAKLAGTTAVLDPVLTEEDRRSIRAAFAVSLNLTGLNAEDKANFRETLKKFQP